jgi:hypothetical protein
MQGGISAAIRILFQVWSDSRGALICFDKTADCIRYCTSNFYKELLCFFQKLLRNDVVCDSGRIRQQRGKLRNEFESYDSRKYRVLLEEASNKRVVDGSDVDTLNHEQALGTSPVQVAVQNFFVPSKILSLGLQSKFFS